MSKFQRFPEFGREVKRPFKAADQCLNCAGFLGECPGYPAGSDAVCEHFVGLPHVGPDTEGQPMPAKLPTCPRLSRALDLDVRRVASFARKECANYDQEQGTCLDGGPCRVTVPELAPVRATQACHCPDPKPKSMSPSKGRCAKRLNTKGTNDGVSNDEGSACTN